MRNAEERTNCTLQGNFTPKKFMLTGKEIFIEIRSSLHTRRGKAGFLLFFIGIFWGINQIMKKDFDQSMILVPILWSTMGLAMMINLQNHKLLYLLPVSRKEFAAGQIRKMIWLMMIILAVFMILCGCISQDAKNFWMNAIWRLIPASASFSIYQNTSIQPIKESDTIGTKIYHLSWLVLILCLGIGFVNFLVFIETWSPVYMILPVMNYAVDIYTIPYFYKRISCSDFYYDEF